MPNAEQISIELGEMSDGMKDRAEFALSKVALDLITDFEANTPVASGILRAEWDFKKEKASGNVLVSVSVFNRMPYAAAADQGSKKGELPWASAGPRTKEEGGRIWSKQAIGGITGPVLEEEGYIDDKTDEVSSFVMGDF